VPTIVCLLPLRAAGRVLRFPSTSEHTSSQPGCAPAQPIALAGEKPSHSRRARNEDHFSPVRGLHVSAAHCGGSLNDEGGLWSQSDRPRGGAAYSSFLSSCSFFPALLKTEELLASFGNSPQGYCRSGTLQRTRTERSFRRNTPLSETSSPPSLPVSWQAGLANLSRPLLPASPPVSPEEFRAGGIGRCPAAD
jgi:hypothetical protein